MSTLVDELRSAAREHPAQVAIRLDEQTVTYRELDALTARMSMLLADEGVQPGDRVAMRLGNAPLFCVVYHAVLRRGAVAVPLNPLLQAPEITHVLADAGCRMLLAAGDGLAAAEDGARAAGVRLRLLGPETLTELPTRSPDGAPAAFAGAVQPSDPAVIIYTSGTTGSPKGATLTHGNVLAAARIARDLVDADQSSTSVGVLPLFHVFGMTAVMNQTLLARGTMSLVARFEPATVMSVIERDAATTFCGVPTMFSALLHHPERDRFDLSSLTVCVSGGAALPLDELREFDTVFGSAVLEGYGLSESAGMAAFTRLGAVRRPGTVGWSIPGTQLRLVDDDAREVPTGAHGEIVLRGPTVMSGYWGRPDATDEILRDGWLHTGDIGRLDDHGYLTIVDRKKDLIIRGGYNVYPREVEEVLHQHPAIIEAAVVGIPDERLGEEVVAALVTSDDLTADEVRSFVKQRLAAYKYPRKVWFLDELPKGPTGKILKREIVAPRLVAAPDSKGTSP